MNVDNKRLKNKLKNLPPIVVHNKLELYKIPSPYKEIIILTCIDKLNVELAIDELRERYGIGLNYWNFILKTREAFDLFNNCEKLY